MTTSTGDTDYVERAEAVAVDPLIELSDPDSQIQAVTVTLDGASPTEALALVGSYEGLSPDYTGGVLTISGSASAETYQQALRAVTYANTSEDPPVSRVVHFAVVDAAGHPVVSANKAIAITTVGDNTVLVASGGTTYYTVTTNTGTVRVDPDIQVIDGDTPQQITQVMVSINNPETSESLSLTPASGFLSSYDPNSGVLTITTDPAAPTGEPVDASVFQSALRKVTYRYVDQTTGDSTPRYTSEITFTIDGSTATKTVARKTDGPVAANDAYGVTQNFILSVSSANGVLSNDYDSAGGLTATKSSDPSHGTVTQFNSNGSFTYVPSTNYTGSDSFQYTVTDANGDTAAATVSITVSIDQGGKT